MSHEITRAIALLFEPQDVVELRVPKTKKSGTIAGYFNADNPSLATEIEELSGQHPSIYYTLNPCDPALLARSQNHTTPRADLTTTDNDIVKRRWLLIDIDPQRPAGVSSSDEEKALALEKMKEVHAFLKSKGWSRPISADSGNGYHLLYRLDLPNSKEVTETIQAVLKFLAEKFDTEHVGIDKAVFNAARITKAYGSLACKGEDTPSRPHRLSKIRNADNGAGTECVTLEQMRALFLGDDLGLDAEPKSKSQPAPKQQSQNTYNTSYNSAPITEAKIEEFLSFYGIEHSPVTPCSSGLMWPLKVCPFDDSHNKGEASVFLNDSGALGFKCFHNSCSEYHWKEFRQFLEIEQDKKFYFETNGPKVVQPSTPSTFKMVTKRASEVETKKVNWLWTNTIPTGAYSLIVGHPGVGKGNVTMDIASRVSTGTAFPSADNKLPASEVLLISIEDSAETTLVPRLQASGADLSRIHIYEMTKDEKAERAFSFDTGLPVLQQFLEDNPEVRCVIIDPVTAHLGAVNSYKDQELRTALTPLAAIAEKYKVAIIGVAHFNKKADSEAITRVGGSMAMIAVARVVWAVVAPADPTEPRLFVPVKMNIAKNVGGLEFMIEGIDVTVKDGTIENSPHVIWGKKTYEQFSSQMAAPNKEPSAPAVTSEIGKASVWLKHYLADGKPRDAHGIVDVGITNGFSERTLKRAKKDIGAISTHINPKGETSSKWYWKLPEDVVTAYAAEIEALASGTEVEEEPCNEF